MQSIEKMPMTSPWANNAILRRERGLVPSLLKDGD